MKQLVLFMLLSMLPVTAQTWATGANMPEPVRAGNTAGYASNGEGYLFVVSGRNFNGLITQKNQRYQIGTNTWSDVANHPTGKLGAATTIVKDSLYTIGGLTTTPGTTNRRVYKYSINENTWSQVAMTPNGITDAKAVTYQDSLIYVVGGYTGNTLLYNAHTNRWRQATPILPGGSLSWGAFAVKGDTLVHVCGTDGFLSSNYFNTVKVGVIDQSDRALITWSDATPFPGNTRTFFDAFTWKDGIIMSGGSTDNTFETHSDECYHYNPGTDTWTQLPSKPTSWNTGNSASVYVNGQWTLACSAGYAGGYLSQTELFTEGSLGIPDFDSGCGLSHFKILSSEIRFCTPKDSAVTLTLYDMHGRKAIETTQKGKIGENQLHLSKDGLPKGIYLCTIAQDGIKATKKLLVD